MSNTLKLIARVRERTDTGSNYAVEKALHVQRNVLKRWLRGEGYPGNEAAFRIARILQLDPGDVVALIEEDRADTEEAREFWRCLPPKGIRKALLSATALAAFLASSVAAALTTAQEAASVQPAIHYANLKRLVARRFDACRRRFEKLCSSTESRQPGRRPAPRIGTILPVLA